jgi:ATP phosphoribosyltransferase regulatory subunit HisZ
LRILDSKNPAMREVIAEAPVLSDYLDDESRVHFDRVQAFLGDVGVEFVLNPRLVRGLDYYSRTVFEWVTDRLGAQSAICSGGRYDGLVAELGGRATPAVGWALGVERIVELMRMEAGDGAGRRRGRLPDHGGRCGAAARVCSHRDAARPGSGPGDLLGPAIGKLQGADAPGRPQRRPICADYRR